VLSIEYPEGLRVWEPLCCCESFHTRFKRRANVTN
jgi:hypothetical protein